MESADARPGSKQSGQQLQPTQSQPASEPILVEESRQHVRRLPQEPDSSLSKLFTLPSWKVNDDRVYVPLCCQGLLRNTRRYRHQRIHLSMDRKMKCLKRGWGIASASLLVRNKCKKTTNFARHMRQRKQGRAYTLHAKPNMQAIIEPA